jgi:hypothetical protein
MLIRNGQAAESMQPPVAEIVAPEEVAEAGGRGGPGMHPFKSSLSAARHCFFDECFPGIVCRCINRSQKNTWGSWNKSVFPVSTAVSSLATLNRGGVETMHVHIPAHRRKCVRLALAALVAVAATHVVPADSNLAAFAAENDAAMTKMMSGMNIKSSGDIDRDFAAMMIPHHQGAIDMAQAELRYGKNEQLRRIAQEIIVDQLQEIAAMHMALNQTLPPMAPVPTQITPLPTPSSSTRHPMHLQHPN